MSQEAKARLSMLGFVTLLGMLASLVVWGPWQDDSPGFAVAYDPILNIHAPTLVLPPEITSADKA